MYDNLSKSHSLRAVVSNVLGQPTERHFRKSQNKDGVG